ncbi:hypothetical protein PCL_11412 [Purpureocillium lilacinum]|uniref:SMODS and SLOG-associating 2TM effector domain-containing protein n=2 Tax=Purpureocillium lilacinum TaxID=33203 RepID=A0A2U3E9Y8_PURLI|nr:hypothetical protein PCL_11412 [Purpureocillium lilacinum]
MASPRNQRLHERSGTRPADHVPTSGETMAYLGIETRSPTTRHERLSSNTEPLNQEEDVLPIASKDIQPRQSATPKSNTITSTGSKEPAPMRSEPVAPQKSIPTPLEKSNPLGAGNDEDGTTEGTQRSHSTIVTKAPSPVLSPAFSGTDKTVLKSGLAHDAASEDDSACCCCLQFVDDPSRKLELYGLQFWFNPRGCSTRFKKAIIDILLVIQLAIGAALTALSSQGNQTSRPSNENRLLTAVTVLSAINTAVSGLIALLRGRDIIGNLKF